MTCCQKEDDLSQVNRDRLQLCLTSSSRVNARGRHVISGNRCIQSSCSQIGGSGAHSLQACLVHNHTFDKLHIQRTAVNKL